MAQRLIPYQHSDGRIWEHFYVDPESGIIYFSRRFNGKRIKFSTHFDIDNALKAKRYASLEFEKRIGKKGKFLKSLIADELDSWLRVKESEGLAKSGMYNIYQAHKDLKKYWGDMYPDEITVDALPEWYSWFKKHRGISIENNIKYLRMFCGYLNQKVVNGKPLLPAVPTIKDPEQKLRDKKRAEKKERVFTAQEFKTILDSAPSKHERALALIMYTMATRVDETLKLKFGYTIFLDENPPVYRWKVGQNKMSLEGVHALHDALFPVLKELRELNQDTDLLFPQVLNSSKAKSAQQVDWKAWREAAASDDNAHPVKWHWTAHTFRHTCLTNLFNDETLNQLLVCKLYRVSMKVAMKVYIKVQLSSILKLQNAVKVKI